ncbi:MAG TPA: hypothetical protein VFQ42_22240 [Mycobacterium sp.]|nr:hypothetical protein [Mycobacterium sp.]
MKQALLELLESKKFIVAMASIVVYGVGKLGLHLDPDLVDKITTALLVYVGAQGVADIGKPAAQIAAASAAVAAQNTTGGAS